MLSDKAAGQPIIAGPYVRQACQRHLRDRQLTASATGHPNGWRFSEEAADIIIGFFETVLRLPDAVGEDGFPKPFLLDPAQVFIVGSLMGWKGRDGYRRFRDGYIEMGKGNGKTPLLAGIGLYGLTMDGETAPEIYPAATTREQARVMFLDMERIVDAVPEFDGVVTRTVNNIAYGLGFIRPYSRDQGQKSGPRPHMSLIDEVHEHPNGSVINKLKAGFKFRKQPLNIEITNSGFDRHSICWQHHQHGQRVLNGTVEDDRFFFYICALDEDDDPLNDETCWIKANPLLGVTIEREYLQRQVENAKNIPDETNTVLRLNFCVWTQQSSRFVDMTKWQACQPAVSDAELVGVPCLAGLDLGQTDDFSAFVRIWLLEDGRVAVRCRFWVPQVAVEKYSTRPYEQWRLHALLEVTEGDITDYDVIEAAVTADCLESGVRECAYDKRFAQQMALHLEGQGITMVDMPQGFQLTGALRRLSELIVAGDLCHGHHPILTWMANNMVVRHGRQQEIRPDKEKATEKIDGMVALTMAIARAIAQPVDPPSVYETRGIFGV